MARKANSMTELRKQTHLKASLQQEKKDKNVIVRLRVGPYREKLWPRAWKCRPRPAASGSIFKTSVTVFPYTDLPAGQ